MIRLTFDLDESDFQFETRFLTNRVEKCTSSRAFSKSPHDRIAEITSNFRPLIGRNTREKHARFQPAKCETWKCSAETIYAGAQ